MPIEIECVCGSAYRLADDRAGQSFTCRVCGSVMALPEATLPAPAVETPAVGVTAAAENAATTVAATVTAPPRQSRPPAPQMPAELPTGMSPLPKTSITPGQPAATPARPSSAQAIGPMETPWHQVRPELRRPPKSWWVLRVVMWGMCVAFLFAPWFGVSIAGEAAMAGGGPAQSMTETVSGWQFVKATVEGLAGGTGEDRSPLFESGMSFDDLPKGAGRVVTGGLMMVVGPNLFAFGLALALLLAFVACKRGGKGAGWPFFIAWAGMLSFIGGWHVITSGEEVSRMMQMVETNGITVGPSPWAYLMALLLIPMALIARSQPDHDLQDAIALAGD